MAKQATSVSLTPEQLQAIDEERKKRARGGEMPSRGVIIREWISLGHDQAASDPRQER